jgi:hypothetical protein
MNLTIVNLERETATDLVITAHWSASMEQDGIVVSEYGSVGLPVKSPSDADFVPFDKLTEKMVLGWVDEMIGDQVRSSLRNQIALAKNPKTVDGLPWAA